MPGPACTVQSNNNGSFFLGKELQHIGALVPEPLRRSAPGTLKDCDSYSPGNKMAADGEAPDSVTVAQQTRKSKLVFYSATALVGAAMNDLLSLSQSPREDKGRVMLHIYDISHGARFSTVVLVRTLLCPGMAKQFSQPLLGKKLEASFSAPANLLRRVCSHSPILRRASGTQALFATARSSTSVQASPQTTQARLRLASPPRCVQQCSLRAETTAAISTLLLSPTTDKGARSHGGVDEALR